jgi:hypothetical protein
VGDEEEVGQMEQGEQQLPLRYRHALLTCVRLLLQQPLLLPAVLPPRTRMPCSGPLFTWGRQPQKTPARRRASRSSKNHTHWVTIRAEAIPVRDPRAGNCLGRPPVAEACPAAVLQTLTREKRDEEREREARREKHKPSKADFHKHSLPGPPAAGTSFAETRKRCSGT